MDVELKPCPFCGELPQLSERDFMGEYTVWAVECRAQECHAERVRVEDCSRAEAITAWNTRPALLRGAGDSARLDWLCSGGLKMVENTFRAGYRVYLDTAPPDHEHAHWQAMTGDFYASAREAIDAAMHAPGGAGGGG